MDSRSTGAPDVRPYVVVSAVQVALTILAVLVSRTEGLGTTLTAMAVMTLAAMNGGMVLTFTMGLRREARFVLWLALVTIVFIAGLLVWPAWDIGQRGRQF